MDIGLTFIPFPPHPSLLIDAGDRSGVNHSMAKLPATKGEPLAQTGVRQEGRCLPLNLNLALGCG